MKTARITSINTPVTALPSRTERRAMRKAAANATRAFAAAEQALAAAGIGFTVVSSSDAQAAPVAA